MNPVADTALLVAALRAEESTRADRLFDDPFAAALSGDRGREVLATYRAAVGPSIPIIEVRTRFFDEELLRLARGGIRQCVILAAGMDARSFRLDWPTGMKVFEIDQPDVLDWKARLLEGKEPNAQRTAVGKDLADDWAADLKVHGFRPDEPSLWLVEGLLQYLVLPLIQSIFRRVNELAASGSVVFYDAVGEILMASPMLAPTLKMMKELGAPWIFATDDPGSLMVGQEWKTRLIDPGAIGAEWGRWPFPVAPPHAVGVPRGYIVEATRA